jgi:PAS domain S-box-containing protein
MKERHKTEEQLIDELAEMHQRITELGASESAHLSVAQAGRQAEEALRESKEKYRTILESIEDGYYEVDIAGNLTFFNDALCRIFGYPADELMGMNERQLMDDETAKAVYQAYNTVYQTGKPTEAFDWEAIRKDRTRRFVQVSVSLMRGSTGEPVGFRGIIRDITERKQAEEALAEERNLLRTLIDNLPDYIYIKDTSRWRVSWGQRQMSSLERRTSTFTRRNWPHNIMPTNRRSSAQVNRCSTEKNPSWIS